MNKRILSPREIKEKLENHKHFLNEDCDGWQYMRADFSYCCIRNWSFYNCDLSYANFYNAVIEYTEFVDVRMHNTNLKGAHLTFVEAYMVILHESYLDHVSIGESSFNTCYFNRCFMSGTMFVHSVFMNCDFIDSDLSGAKNVPYIPMVCPDEGSFIGWKKCLTNDQPISCGIPEHDRECLVKLRILEDSKRSSGTGRKCRCDKAEVISIEKFDGTPLQKAYSYYDKSFIYEVGKIVSVDNFNEDRFDECSAGIHFFITKQEAINYG